MKYIENKKKKISILQTLEGVTWLKGSQTNWEEGRDITFSPSIVHRETIIDLVTPVDIPENIVVGHERPI